MSVNESAEAVLDVPAKRAAFTLDAEPLEDFTFATDERGRRTFSGTLMNGRKVISGFFGKALIRPEMWAGQNGKVVPLMLQHQKFPSYGLGRLEVRAQSIRIEGVLHDTESGRAFGDEMESLLEGGVKLEMSMGGYFEGERPTRKGEPGDYTWDAAVSLEASVVLSGEMNGTRFRMESGWEPERDYREADGLSGDGAGADAGEGLDSSADVVSFTAEQRALLAGIARLEAI